MAVDDKDSIFDIYKKYRIQFRQFYFLFSFFLVQAVMFSRPQLIIYVIGYIIYTSMKYISQDSIQFLLSFLQVSEA